MKDFHWRLRGFFSRPWPISCDAARSGKAEQQGIRELLQNAPNQAKPSPSSTYTCDRQRGLIFDCKSFYIQGLMRLYTRPRTRKNLLHLPLLKNEWVKIQRSSLSSPSNAWWNGCRGAGLCQALAAEGGARRPGFTRATLPRLQSPPADDGLRFEAMPRTPSGSGGPRYPRRGRGLGSDRRADRLGGAAIRPSRRSIALSRFSCTRPVTAALR